MTDTKRRSDSDDQDGLTDADDVLRRMLNTPPRPHKPPKPKKAKAKKKPAK